MGDSLEGRLEAQAALGLGGKRSGINPFLRDKKTYGTIKPEVGMALGPFQPLLFSKDICGRARLLTNQLPQACIGIRVRSSSSLRLNYPCYFSSLK